MWNWGWNIGKRWHSLNVLYFGSDEFSIHSLKALNKLRGQKIDKLQVVTRPPKSCGRYKSIVKNVPIVDAVNRLGLSPTWYCDSREDMLRLSDLMETQRFNMIIAVSFGKLIPAQLLQNIPYSLNVHPSLLPRYKGASPIQHTLLNQDEHTGVTVQTLHPHRFDHGSIIAQTPLLKVNELVQKGTISEFEPNFPKRTATLMDQLGLKGGSLLEHVISKRLYLNPSKSNSLYNPCYASKITTEMKQLHWSNENAETALTKLETLGPLYTFKQVDEKKTKTSVNGKCFKRVILHNFHTVDSIPYLRPGEFTFNPIDQSIYVQCLSDAVKVQEIQFEGFKKEKPTQFMKSLKKRCGTETYQLHCFL